jgi:hypothetical protein
LARVTGIYILLWCCGCRIKVAVALAHDSYRGAVRK